LEQIIAITTLLMLQEGNANEVFHPKYLERNTVSTVADTRERCEEWLVRALSVSLSIELKRLTDCVKFPLINLAVM
jgi:hypothetical protein